MVSAAVGKGTNLRHRSRGWNDSFVESYTGEKDTALEPKHSLPQRGFVNGLAIASSGKFLLAGVGQEPRLGRWGRDEEGKWSGHAQIDHAVNEDDSDEDDEESDIPWMKKGDETVEKIIAALVFSSRQITYLSL